MKTEKFFGMVFWLMVTASAALAREKMSSDIFENKNMLLTRTGISAMNDELRALIEYLTFNNPLEYHAEETNMRGLSHYWGNIWVSLEGKQIEHATMLEIVSAEMILPGQSNKQVMTITREIEVKKLH